MTITFEAKPIETAPKNREIMLYHQGAWTTGKWLGIWHLGWYGMPNCWRISNPTHWAEISEMAVQP